jgi:hypothetical protein
MKEDAWCLPLLMNERKLVFLYFTNVDPQKLLTWLLLIDLVANLERNAMPNINIERRGYDKEG